MTTVHERRDQLIDDVIKREGGIDSFTNDPNDPGGKTKAGVTEATFRHYGYDGEVEDASPELIRAIYRDRYWDAVCGDDLYQLSPMVADEVFDSAVNIGPGFIEPVLQRALNLLNLNNTVYYDLSVDGQIGARTIAALSALLAKRGHEGEIVLQRMLDGKQREHYFSIAETHPERFEKFVFGWFLNRTGP